MHVFNRRLCDIAVDYLILFRRAKQEETLDIMASAKERDFPEHKDAIAQAFSLREKELGLCVTSFH